MDKSMVRGFKIYLYLLYADFWITLTLNPFRVLWLAAAVMFVPLTIVSAFINRRAFSRRDIQNGAIQHGLQIIISQYEDDQRPARVPWVGRKLWALLAPEEQRGLEELFRL